MVKRLYNQLLNVIPQSQHCQRNWDLTQEVTDEHIEVLKLAVSQCPSKQNNAFYWTHFIKNRELIEKLYDCTWGYYDRQSTSPTYMGTRTEDHVRRNDQCFANLLVVFESWHNYELQGIAGYADDRHSNEEEVTFNVNMTDKQREQFEIDPKEVFSDGTMDERVQQLIARDRWMAVGIAAGYLNMTAHQLGLKTGFNQCYGNPPKTDNYEQPEIKYPSMRIKDIMGMKGEPLLFMGIGYPNEGVEHSRGHFDRTFKFWPKRKQPIVTKVWE